MADTNLQALLADRRRLRSATTRLYNSKEDWDAISDVGRLETLVSKVLEAKADLKENHMQTVKALYGQLKEENGNKTELDVKVDQESDLHEQYLDKLLECHSVLKSRLKALEAPGVSLASGYAGGGSSEPGMTRLKVPNLPIPYFTSKPDEDISQFLKSLKIR